MINDFVIVTNTPHISPVVTRPLVDNNMFNEEAVASFSKLQPMYASSIKRTIKIAEILDGRTFDVVVDWLNAVRSAMIESLRNDDYKNATITHCWSALRAYLVFLMERIPNEQFVKDVEHALDKISPPVSRFSPKKKLHLDMHTIVMMYGLPFEDMTSAMGRWVTCIIHLFNNNLVEIEDIPNMGYDEEEHDGVTYPGIKGHVGLVKLNKDLTPKVDNTYDRLIFKCATELSPTDVPKRGNRVKQIVRTIIGALAVNGLRASEITNARLTHYDPSECMLRTPLLKGRIRENRVWVNTEHVLTFAKKLAIKNDSPYLVPRVAPDRLTMLPQSISRQTVWNHVKHALTQNVGARVVVPANAELSPHGIRASAITAMIKDYNLDIHQVADWAGHSSINTTHMYVRETVGSEKGIQIGKRKNNQEEE